MRTTATGERRLGAAAWALIFVGWLAITAAWLDGRVLMMVDQWREWWSVARWWQDGVFAPPRTTSGFGFVPPWYMLPMWPAAAVGGEPSAIWALPVQLGGLAAIGLADRLGGRRAALLLAFSLLGPPGLFWFYANVSASWGWILVMLGWSLALAGRLRTGLAFASVGAWFGYVVLPAFCGLAIWVMLRSPRQAAPRRAALIASAVAGLGYLLPALRLAVDRPERPPIGGLVEAALFVVGGPLPGLVLAGTAAGLLLRPGSRDRGLIMLVIWAGTAFGIAAKTNYWALHYTLTTVAVLLVPPLSLIIDRRGVGAATLAVCAVLPAAVWLWPGTPILRPSEAVREPSLLPSADHRVWHADLSWRYFEEIKAAAVGRRVAGDLVPVVEWAQLYARQITDERTLIATTVAGPWCEQAYHVGCRFSATPDPSSVTLYGPALLEVIVEKGGRAPADIRFVMSDCDHPRGEVFIRPAEAPWIDQYSRWKFVLPVDVPGCRTFSTFPDLHGWTLWYVQGAQRLSRGRVAAFTAY